jgi:tryptophan-rich sensory protein
MVYNAVKPEHKAMLGGMFLINAALNIIWSVLFFGGQMLGIALLETIILGASVAILMWKILPTSLVAGLLLAPYFVWVTFAAYLNYVIWTLNT